MASWTTPADVLALTGVTVTAAQLSQAQGILDLFSGTTLAAIDDISDRDLRFLKMAAGYQAAWIAGQVDVMTRMDVKSLSQDGMSFTPADTDALTVAPLARRCLDRLSWNRPQSLRVSGCHDARYPTFADYAHAWLTDQPEVDNSPDWQPL